MAPRPALADHNSTYVVCPDPVPEGDSARMGIRRSGYKITSAWAFTDARYHTADPDDYTEYHGVKFSQSEGKTLWIPIETTQDTRPEPNETFAIGFWDGGVWHHCVVTIVDDDSPSILNVDLITWPLDAWAYRAGQNIDVTVTLDAHVDVAGSPQLALFFSHDGETTWRGASYLAGSGTRELLFRYVVQPSDFDADGLTVGAAANNEDRTPAYGFTGTITATGTDAPIDYAHPGIEPHWQQRVDGRPYVRSSRTVSKPEANRQTYRANETIKFAFDFNTPVVVNGDVCVDLYLGDGRYTDDSVRQATYLGGSGTRTLEFGYTIRSGDMDSDGIGLTLGSDARGFCGEGSIEGEDSGVRVNPWYLGTGPQHRHRVDTEPPAVRTVSIVSSPDNGKAYAAGETISIEVAFSEHVIRTGAPYLELDVGDATRRATFNADRGASNRLVFEYEVQRGDTDTDGVGVGANSVQLDDGDIFDPAGNNASVSHAAVDADTAHRVAG